MATKTVKRSYKFRFYPTDEQASMLARTFGSVRLVYNKVLAERARSWKEERKNVSFSDTSKLLTKWKKEDNLAFLSEVSCVPLQQGLRHLDIAYSNFFKKRASYPQFKSRKNRKASAEYTRSGFSWSARKRELKLAKMAKPLNIVWSRNLPEGASPSTVTVSRDPANRWFVSMLVEDEIAQLDKNERIVGIDLGVTALATLSDGTVYHSPDDKRDRNRLARAQRAHAKKKLGSQNREKARLKAARLSARISDSRRNNLHQITTQIIRENQVIVIEDLNVKGMSSKAKTGDKKRGLNRAIRNAAFAEFRSMLEYKAAWYGREVVVIDRFFPSTKTCSSCGTIKKVALSERVYSCANCGHIQNRDLNAAHNIKAAGLAVSAYGDLVRPKDGLTSIPARVDEVGNPLARASGIPRL